MAEKPENIVLTDAPDDADTAVIADGLRAVLLLSIAVICATFTLLYLLAKKKSNVLVAIWVTMVAAAASRLPSAPIRSAARASTCSSRRSG